MQVAQYNKLKTRTRNLIIIYIIIVIIGIKITIDIYNRVELSTNQQANVKKDIVNINQTISETEIKIKEIKESYKLWDKLAKNNKVQKGLEIDKAKSFLTNLEKRFKLSTPIDVMLSPPVQLKDVYETKTTVVVSSEVNLKLAAPTDEIIMNVIDSIIQNYPGFVSLKFFSLEKKSLLNDEIINKISRGIFVPMIESNVTFEWRDFKDVQEN